MKGNADTLSNGIIIHIVTFLLEEMPEKEGLQKTRIKISIQVETRGKQLTTDQTSEPLTQSN